MITTKRCRTKARIHDSTLRTALGLAKSQKTDAALALVSSLDPQALSPSDLRRLTLTYSHCACHEKSAQEWQRVTDFFENRIKILNFQDEYYEMLELYGERAVILAFGLASAAVGGKASGISSAICAVGGIYLGKKYENGTASNTIEEYIRSLKN